MATEAFTDQMNACVAVVDDGLADPDPWHGLRMVIEQLCELQARNRGFTAAFTSAFPRAMDLAAKREAALASLAELTRRARTQVTCGLTSSWTISSSC
ncbi:hypothetical protein NKG94_01280 [Micromonospora sp. M12]